MTDAIDPPEPAAPSAVPIPFGRRRVPALTAGLIGLVVGLSLPGVLELLGDDRSDSGRGEVGAGAKADDPLPPGGSDISDDETASEPVRLPETLGPYVHHPAALTDVPPERAAEQVRRIAVTEENSTRMFSEAYGGAPAAIRHYADPEFEELPVARAVRSWTPAPFAPYEDIDSLRLAAPSREVVEVGEAHCLIFSARARPAGEEVEPEDRHVQFC